MTNFVRYIWDMLFGLQDPAGFAVNLVIAALFIFGCADVVVSLYKLIRERSLIRRAKKALTESGASCPAEPEEEVLEFLQVSRSSLIGRRISRVIHLRTAGLGQREVLQQLSGERIDSYGALARYIGMTLTLLGLLGTVFGLSFALVKIQGALAGVDNVEGLNQLTRALSETLQGMKTAFGCTLAGLMSALILSYFNYVVRRGQSSLGAELEEFIACDLLPTLESVDPGADESAKAFANSLKSAGGELNRVRKTVTAAASEYKTASEAMVGVSQHLEVATQSFASSVSEITANQQLFNQTMQETRAAINSMNTMLATQFENLRAYTENSNKLLAERISSVEQIGQSNLAVQQSLKSIAEKFHPAIQEYHNQFREFLTQSQSEFKLSLKQLLAEINEHYKEGVVSHVSSSHKAFQEGLAQHLSKLQAVVERNEAGLSALLAKHNDSLSSFSHMMVDVNLRTQNLFDRISSENNGHAKRAAAGLMEDSGNETYFDQP